MIIPDQASLLARLKAALPVGWFPNDTPVLDGLLTGFCSTWSTLFDALAYVRAQSRIVNATDIFLDIAAVDYFGFDVRRQVAESDATFRARLRHEFVREHATRGALIAIVTEVTGSVPAIIEFARPTDTGAYGIAAGYGVGGRWGSLGLPFQALMVTNGDATSAIAKTLPTATIAWTRTN